MSMVAGVYESVAEENLEELRDEIGNRKVELESRNIDTGDSR